MIEERVCIKVDGSRHFTARDAVADEREFELYLNGKFFKRVSLSPNQIKEFVTGHILSELVIRDPSEIVSLIIDDTRVSVLTRDSSINKVDAEDISRSFSIAKESIFRSMSYLLDSDLHRATGGIHSAGIFKEDGPMWLAEDIGRHNAIDKAIGGCVLNGIDLRSTFAAVTSRISSGLALKCSRVGIPILASRGAPTTLAVDIANENGITLIGFVRGDRMNVYTYPERIAELRDSR